MLVTHLLPFLAALLGWKGLREKWGRVKLTAVGNGAAGEGHRGGMPVGLPLPGRKGLGPALGLLGAALLISNNFELRLGKR